MGRYTGREKRQKALFRLAIAVWVVILALVLCIDARALEVMLCR